MRDKGLSDRKHGPYRKRSQRSEDWWEWAEQHGLKPELLAEKGLHYETAVQQIDSRYADAIRSKANALYARKLEQIDFMARDEPTRNALLAMSYETVLGDDSGIPETVKRQIFDHINNELIRSEVLQ